MNKTTINQAAFRAFQNILAAHVDAALFDGKMYAQNHCPVDTSSLQESIYNEPAEIDGFIIKASLTAGGVDFRGKIMSTGQEGNYVNYAAEQEQIHGFMAGAVPAIIEKLRGRI
jgi:hypothetical protein